jgi:hypothetical protein
MSGRGIAGLFVLAALAACAPMSTSRLVSGNATAAEVDKVMGPPAERRVMPNGETVSYYSRLPAGREMFAARFGADGRLIAIEQRLSPEFVAQVRPRVSTASQVRDLLGPPDQVRRFAGIEGEVWTYPIYWISTPRVLNVDFSSDGRVREINVWDDTDTD